MAKKNRDMGPEGGRPKKPGKVQNVFGHPVRNLIVAAVVSILLGAAVILRPLLVSQYCGYCVGGLVGVVGLIYIIFYFCHRPVSGEYRSEFAIGLILLLAGAYVGLSGILIGGSGVGYVLVIRILGLMILADALLKLQYALDIARMHFRQWWIVLILALLGAAVGVLMTTDFSGSAIGARTSPASYFYVLGANMGLVKNMGQYNAFYSGMRMIGIALCVNGVLDLGAMVVIAVRNYNARRDEAIAAGTAMVAAARQEELRSASPADSFFVQAPPEEPFSAPAPQQDFYYDAAVAPVAPAAPAAPAAPEAPAAPPAPPAAPAAPAAPEKQVYIPEPPQAIPADPVDPML